VDDCAMRPRCERQSFTTTDGSRPVGTATKCRRAMLRRARPAMRHRGKRLRGRIMFGRDTFTCAQGKVFNGRSSKQGGGTKLANLATKAGVEGRQRLKIHTPLIQVAKADIIRRGLALGVDYALTSSCYDPAADGAPCSRCDACLLREKGSAEAGTRNPLLVKYARA